MAEATGKILEGVFAIKKPPSLSSAQVLRDLQEHFTPSGLFAPLVQDTRAKQEEQDRHQPKRRRRNASQNLVKIGHGGTLDPLATGVLIVGVGRQGTKHLNDFLGCTKTYDTVVLFGKSTDTYDIAGKIVAEAPYQHISRDQVEENLSRFQGKTKQVPPIYSALKINGMKAYEYARSGMDLPRELESREMEVSECTLVEWYEGGEHDFRWPAEEAAQEDKDAAKRLMGTAGPMNGTTGEVRAIEKVATAETSASNMQRGLDSKSASSSTKQTPIPGNKLIELDPSTKAALHTHYLPAQSTTPSPAPAARIRLTVSSGFYVRSFAHDLGLACNSYGIMAELVRSRQAEFACTAEQPTSNEPGLIQALTYADLKAGEAVWGPKVQSMLERWMQIHPTEEGERIDDRDRDRGWKDRKPHRTHSGGSRGRFSAPKPRDYPSKRMRNSSSPE